ncbi:uncharacterized protein N7496_008763 [Penicillium cataractarum]|uniref:Uncharacterized protein n=1 Tax=Penicillium cataractarum TaxID=2100454 RepID=A0A9W9RZ22_9EURO|nr:uncharacterized protein N7496_008763 [Penicillium cataractarum]KAJ5369003.1 hypothetical protein N7496_008763 [Penicillium cataractarum]
MCVIITQKYHICGCILNIQDLYCKPTETCWGPKMIIINCHLQTCKECWRSGDKRINNEIAALSQRNEEHRRYKTHQHEQYSAPAKSVQQEELSSGEEDFEALHPSRPTTPELDLNPQQMPRWLFEAEVMADMSRACEPVKREKIWKNYRAWREKTDWYLVEDLLGEWLGPTVSSFEDEKAPVDEDDDY